MTKQHPQAGIKTLTEKPGDKSQLGLSRRKILRKVADLEYLPAEETDESYENRGSQHAMADEFF